jgi:serine/threonine protein kinase
MTVESSAVPLGADLLSSGTVLASKYRIERVIGEGGMCVVFQALRIDLDDRVAIKVLRPEMAAEKQLVERFLREGRAVGSIRNEHVVRVLDIGKLDGGIPYLVLEYLEGSDLEAVLEAQGPLPTTTAVDYVLQACEAIQQAHIAGIIHRDLKPANLFLTRLNDGSPWIKVLDFGISKHLSGLAQDGFVTSDTSILGSPRYMSPEQMRPKGHIDARTDIWGLGALLFELITNRTPFLGSTLPELCAQILRDEAPAAHKLRRGCPEGLSRVISRCLGKTARERFKDVTELAVALSPFASAVGQASALRMMGSFRAEAPSCPGVVLTTISDDADDAEPARLSLSQLPQRSRVAASFGALMALAVLGAGGFVSTRSTQAHAMTYAHARVRAETPAMVVVAPIVTPPPPAVDVAPPPAAPATVSVAALKRAPAPVVVARHPPAAVVTHEPEEDGFSSFGMRK